MWQVIILIDQERMFLQFEWKLGGFNELALQVESEFCYLRVGFEEYLSARIASCLCLKLCPIVRSEYSF